MVDIDHRLTVQELLEVLQDLLAKPGARPSLLLHVNEVRNLAILTEDRKYVGFIDLLQGIPREERIDLFGDLGPSL